MAIAKYTGKVMDSFSYPGQDSSSSSLCTASDTLDVKIKGNIPCATAVKDKRNNLPAKVSAYHRCILQLMLMSLR